MTAVTYVSKRSVIESHSIDLSYDIDLPLSSYTPKPKAKKKMHESLGGGVQTILHSISDNYSCTTSLLEGEEYDAAWEFFASVIGGEVFQFDGKGTAAAPDNPVSAILVGDPLPRLINKIPQYRITFTVRFI